MHGDVLSVVHIKSFALKIQMFPELERQARVFGPYGLGVVRGRFRMKTDFTSAISFRNSEDGSLQLETFVIGIGATRYYTPLLDMFCKNKGSLDAIFVWNDGYTIEKVVITDGVMTETNLLEGYAH
ncbi:MAG: hypothetical protein WC663_00535 [Patescibacteria group bacterium]